MLPEVTNRPGHCRHPFEIPLEQRTGTPKNLRADYKQLPHESDYTINPDLQANLERQTD